MRLRAIYFVCYCICIYNRQSDQQLISLFSVFILTLKVKRSCSVRYCQVQGVVSTDLRSRVSFPLPLSPNHRQLISSLSTTMK